MSPRNVARVFEAVLTSEGVGAKVRRSIGTAGLQRLNPFLMLDHAFVPPGAGFPDHPHRGFETVTYVLDGSIAHEDFTGSTGVISTGDLQFMTAGRAIVHAEMPIARKDGQPVVGMQLWVSLEEGMRDVEPRYRDMRDAEIPHARPSPGVDIKVISGDAYGVHARNEIPISYTPMIMLDVRMQKDTQISQPIPQGWTAFLYTLSGSGTTGATKFSMYDNVVFNTAGDSVDVRNDRDDELRVLLVAGKPNTGEIMQYGPFVSNSKEGLQKAFHDYQAHLNGFERAEGWHSKIGGIV